MLIQSQYSLQSELLHHERGNAALFWLRIIAEKMAEEMTAEQAKIAADLLQTIWRHS